MPRSRDPIDEPSRLKQFAWEQWKDQIIVVIFRPGNDGVDRYVVKRYVEQALFQSERWRQLSNHFPQISPVRAYSLTPSEVELMRRILDYHLSNSLHLRITQSNDQLISYEDLLDFTFRAQELYNKRRPTPPNNGKKSFVPLIPSILSSYMPPSSAKLFFSPQSQSTPIKLSSSFPSSRLNITQVSTTNGHHNSHKSNPIASQPSNIDGNGWVQINNVYLPFLLKNQQRLVPYPVLVSCKILQPDELRATLIPATLADITLINSMIRDCQINNEQIPEKTALINIRHVLIGTKNLVYLKILPKDYPTSKINRQYKSVLALRGGFSTITTRTVPFIYSSNNQSYVPLNEILNIYPSLHIQLKGLACIPRPNEFDYLQLVQTYVNEKELPLDTLLVSMEDLNQRQIIASNTVPLIEYQSKERMKLEEQINLLNKSSNNKRKNLESHDSRVSQQRMKLTPLTASSHRWLTSNNGHRGRTRWQ